MRLLQLRNQLLRQIVLRLRPQHPSRRLTSFFDRDRERYQFGNVVPNMVFDEAATTAVPRTERRVQTESTLRARRRVDALVELDSMHHEAHRYRTLHPSFTSASSFGTHKSQKASNTKAKSS